MDIELVGYHGTDHALVEKIRDEGFISSKGDDQWLGSGVYFYVQGLSEKPEEQAKKWSILQAWDKKNKRNRYSAYAVFRAVIRVAQDNFLDLNTSAGQQILEYIKNCCIKKLIHKNHGGLNFIDGIIINFAHDEMPDICIDVVKCNMCIKLTREDRIYKLNSRIPNCSICAVYDPSKNITEFNLLEAGGI